MNGVIEKIREIVGRKKGKERFTLTISPEDWEKVEKAIKEHLTELEAENLVLKRKLKELEKKKREEEGKEKPEEIKVAEEALKEKKEIERRKKRFRFLPEKRNIKVISNDGDLFSSEKGRLPYLYALEMEEVDGGNYKVNLILTDGKKEFGRMETDLSFDQLLNEPNIVSKLRIGDLIVPIKSDGQELLKVAKTEDIIGDMKRMNKFYTEELSKLKKEVEYSESVIANLRKENETLKTTINRLGTEISILQHKLEVSDALMRALGVREREMADRTALLEIGARDMAIRSIIAQSEYNQLLEAFQALKNTLTTAFLTPPDEETRQMVLAEVDRIASMLEKLRPKEIKVEEIPTPKKAKKGGAGE